MGITYKPMYHMYWKTDCILPSKWGLQIYPSFIWTGQQTVYSSTYDNRLNITLLMGNTHTPMYHMKWTTDCILPF